MKKVVGRVTEQECNEIQSLYERRNGLNELAKILTAKNAELYERMIQDLGETSTKFQNWWNSMAVKYSWEKIENGNWEIDFTDGTIYLVTPE